MEEVKTYGITEANRRGISGCVKDAETFGAVILKRDSVPVALLLPLNFHTFLNSITPMMGMIENDINNNSIPIGFENYALKLRDFINEFKKMPFET